MSPTYNTDENKEFSSTIKTIHNNCTDYLHTHKSNNNNIQLTLPFTTCKFEMSSLWPALWHLVKLLLSTPVSRIPFECHMSTYGGPATPILIHLPDNTPRRAVQESPSAGWLYGRPRKNSGFYFQPRQSWRHGHCGSDPAIQRPLSVFPSSLLLPVSVCLQLCTLNK